MLKAYYKISYKFYVKNVIFIYSLSRFSYAENPTTRSKQATIAITVIFYDVVERGVGTQIFRKVMAFLPRTFL